MRLRDEFSPVTNIFEAALLAFIFLLSLNPNLYKSHSNKSFYFSTCLTLHHFNPTESNIILYNQFYKQRTGSYIFTYKTGLKNIYICPFSSRYCQMMLTFCKWASYKLSILLTPNTEIYCWIGQYCGLHKFVMNVDGFSLILLVTEKNEYLR